MHVTEALKSRISIRSFLDTPVSEEQVKAILDAARWSPSGGNLQPWRVIAVSGDARNAVTELAAKTLGANPQWEDDEYPIYPKNLPQQYKDRRYKCGEDLYSILGIPREDKAARLMWMSNNFTFFNAPVGLFFVIDRCMGNGQWAHVGMFMQSIALAAVEQGLGTCMQEAWAMIRKTLHTHFHLADNELLYCGMALGCPNPNAPINTLRTEREEVEGFATFKGF